MQKILKYTWRELRKTLSAEQTFYLVLAFIFWKYQAERKKSDIKGFNREAFEKAFAEYPKQVPEEAVRRLAEKIDWNSGQNNLDIKSSINRLGEWIESLFHNPVKLTPEYSDNKELYQEFGPALQRVLLLLNEAETLASEEGVYPATPASAQKLIAEFFKEQPILKAADLCCGTGLPGLNILDAISGKWEEIEYYGADRDDIFCSIAKILLWETGIPKGKIECRNLLDPPEGPGEGFDFVFMDVPRGRNRGEFWERDDVRLERFNRKTVYSDWIFIKEALYQLNENGRAAVLVTPGALIRANEKRLREQIFFNDWLECVITLPAGLYPGTSTGTELMIFCKRKQPARQNKILLADISRYSIKRHNNISEITHEGIEVAVKCLREYREISDICTVLTKRNINLETYSFKPMQYIQYGPQRQGGQTFALGDISEIIRGSQTLPKETSSEEGDACIINIRDIQDERVHYQTADKISRLHPACKEKFRIREDDILLTSKGAVIKSAIVEAPPPEAFASGNITILRTNREKYDPYVLFEYLNSSQGMLELEKIQSGTTIRILNNTNLKTFQIPVYDKSLMEKIGSRLKRNRKIYFQKLKNLEEDYNKERNILNGLLKEEGEHETKEQ